MMLGGWTWTPNNSWEWRKKTETERQENKIDLEEEQMSGVESKTLQYHSTNTSSNGSKG